MRFNRRTLLAVAAATPAIARISHVTSAQSATWTLLDDASGPIARWDHVLLPDPSGNRLFVFGGRDGNGVSLSDLWTFDLTSQMWSAIESEGPAPRFGVAAAILPDASGFILFAGQSESVFYNDLWQFDFEQRSWTLLDDGTTIAPSPRYGFGGDFDALGRFVVSHGFTFDGRFDDTWAFDTIQNAWAHISPPAETRPLRRCLHEVLAVEGGDHLLLYAGCSSGYGPCPQGDLWTFDVSSATWTQLAPDALPAPRSNPAMCSAGQEIVLVGGLTDAGPTSDVWHGKIEDQHFQWTESVDASNAIAPRSSHDMATIEDALYVFGGLGVNGPLADLWQYRPGA